MRIISQDNTEDIPYEMSRVYIGSLHSNTIYAEVFNGDPIALGTYGGAVDAKVVMESIRNYYRSGLKCFELPDAESIRNRIKEVLNEKSRNS